MCVCLGVGLPAQGTVHYNCELPAILLPCSCEVASSADCLCLFALLSFPSFESLHKRSSPSRPCAHPLPHYFFVRNILACATELDFSLFRFPSLPIFLILTKCLPQIALLLMVAVVPVRLLSPWPLEGRWVPSVRNIPTPTMIVCRIGTVVSSPLYRATNHYP